MPGAFPQPQVRSRAPVRRRLLLHALFALHTLAAACLAVVSPSAGSAALDLWPVAGVVGATFPYEVRKGDTVTAISARYAVSERALIRDNALKPPYRIKAGEVLQIDNRHVVPEALAEGIVINLPQRLLFVFRNGRLAGAYAVALGKPTWQTPTGSYFVRTKEQDKPWIVPPSIQEEMRQQGRPVLTRVEPGPDNPLGRYWIGLSLSGYGIHGTNAPNSIYRMRTHGCIRVHPDDIEALYGHAARNMPVRIIYAHTVMARLADGRIVAEVNPDVYNRGGDPLTMLRNQARAEGLESGIDWTLAARIARARMGQASEIGRAAAADIQHSAAGTATNLARAGNPTAGCGGAR